MARRVGDVASIARRLVAARRAKNLRAADLARMTGVAPNALSNWEQGIRRPSLDQVARLLPALDVTLDFIYFGDDRGLAWDVKEAIMAAMAAGDAAEVPEPARKTASAA
jgi:transcriptional regulator with XRE-family HTH domain